MLVLTKMMMIMLTSMTTVPTFHLAKDPIHPSLASMSDPSLSLILPTSMLPHLILLLQSTLLIQLGRLNGISVHIIKCDYVTHVSPEYCCFFDLIMILHIHQHPSTSKTLLYLASSAVFLTPLSATD